METGIKDISINGNDYQIRAFDAQTGSKLLMKLMGTFQKLITNDKDSQEDKPDVIVDDETFATKLIQFLLMNLPDAEFDKVQRYALSVCFRYVSGGQGTTVAMPILAGNRFAFDDLDTDIDSVLKLTSSSLFANLSPFFSKSGLKQVMMVS